MIEAWAAGEEREGPRCMTSATRRGLNGTYSIGPEVVITLA